MKKQKQEQEKCCFKDVSAGLSEWRTEQRERNVFVKG
jgi:hypothetical protein